MAPNPWATAEQTNFLTARLPSYLKAKENQKQKSLSRFWIQLEGEWFAIYKEEPALGLPDAAPRSDLMPQQLTALGAATNFVYQRLKAWMRYQDSLSSQGNRGASTSTATSKKSKRSLFKLLQKSGATRPMRAVEMYQKIHHVKIKEEVLSRGYGELNEETEAERAAATSEPGSIQARVLTEEELADAEFFEDRRAIERVQRNRRLRMSLWRTTSIEMYAAESDEVKREVETATEEVNEALEAGEGEGEEMTPEEYQQ
ncbi:hypothetical protein B0H10DRAFT_255881 [Mycena sp. CBHHK59/15]|nr:hypothetical protein B0H10DRAFT_255881 [Mycena sp. CBHHK59/15]